jgi:hypothetical protein
MTRLVSVCLLSIVSTILFGITMMPACTMSQRQDTIHASVVAVDGARRAFVPWDKAHQQGIVDADKAAGKSREQVQADIADYRATQEKIKEGFTVAYRALTLAALQNDDPSLTTAITQGAAVVHDVQILMGSK